MKKTNKLFKIITSIFLFCLALAVLVPITLFIKDYVVYAVDKRSKGEYSYIPQSIDDNEYNYNNIMDFTNSYFPVLTSDAEYYETVGFFNGGIYKTTQNGKELLLSNGGKCIIKYGDSLYFNDYGLYEYNLKDKQKNALFHSDMGINKHFVLDNYSYIELSHLSSSHKSLVELDLQTNEVYTVSDNIFSFGVVDGKLFYVTNERNKYFLYKYENKASEFVSTFELAGYVDSDMNYTKNHIIFKLYKNEDNHLVLYNLDNKTLKVLDANVTMVIAYEEYMFAVIYSEEDIYKYKIFRISIDTLKMDKVCEFKNSPNIRVYSDDSVYVIANDFYGMRKYFLDGTYEDVYKKR